jgi:ribosomal-protein-alanine N-acetyltransferase
MNSLLSISTGELRLVPATLALARAECRGIAELSQRLGTGVPTNWPPPLTEDTLDYWVGLLEAEPSAFPWAKWYLLLESESLSLPIGICGFKGRPIAREVEIGYSLVETQQGRGLGSAAVELLLAWAGSTGLVDRVCAHTLPDLTPSIRVLEKNGFALTGPGSEPGTLRYERPVSLDRTACDPFQ